LNIKTPPSSGANNRVPSFVFLSHVQLSAKPDESLLFPFPIKRESCMHHKRYWTLSALSTWW